MQKARLFALTTVFALSMTPLMAASIVYTATGTLGPILNGGSDPAGADGKSGTITISILSTAKPSSKTATTATYKLAVGSISADINGTTYKNTKAATLKYSVPKTGADTMTVSGSFTVSGINSTIVGTISLPAKTFTAAVIKHPTAIASTVNVTQPASKVSYTASILGTTVLGLTGTIN